MVAIPQKKGTTDAYQFEDDAYFDGISRGTPVVHERLSTSHVETFVANETLNNATNED